MDSLSSEDTPCRVTILTTLAPAVLHYAFDAEPRRALIGGGFSPAASACSRICSGSPVSHRASLQQLAGRSDRVCSSYLLDGPLSSRILGVESVGANSDVVVIKRHPALGHSCRTFHSLPHSKG